MRLPNTVNVFCGWQMPGKMKEDIMKEVLRQMGGVPSICAVQVGYEIIRVTFSSPAAFQQAKSRERVQLFDVWCTIQGGGPPPPTIVHVFDFPYEGSDDSIKVALRSYGAVKGIHQQTYISNRNVFNGTRMVSLVMENPPPCLLKIDGYNCRTWYRGQPLICNLCNGPGHRSAECPNKDKCRVCGQSGHIGRHCTNAWGGSRTLVESSPPGRRKAFLLPLNLSLLLLFPLLRRLLSRVMTLTTLLLTGVILLMTLTASQIPLRMSLRVRRSAKRLQRI